MWQQILILKWIADKRNIQLSTLPLITVADILLLEGCVQKVLNNRAAFLAENAVLHFLMKEMVHLLACWALFPTVRLQRKSATEMMVAMQRGFIHLQA